MKTSAESRRESLLKYREEQTKVALKYVENCRSEVIERLKMREQIILGYVAAVAALYGYAAKPPAESFDYRAMLASGIFQLLIILLPLLSLVASFSIALHQEQIQAFSEYLALDLPPFLPAGTSQVPVWEKSRSRRISTRRILTTVLIGQLILISGPWLLAAGLYVQYVGEPDMRLKDVLLVPGFVIILLSVIRLHGAWRFRLEGDNRIAEGSMSGTALG